MYKNQCMREGCDQVNVKLIKGQCHRHYLELRRHPCGKTTVLAGARSDVINLTGQRFGYYEVLEAVRTEAGKIRWRCKCDCGTIKLLESKKLRSGECKSCGCQAIALMSAAKITHGMFGTPVYTAFMSMRRRCTNPNHDDYHLYGGRGIKVCDAWRTFEQFYADMGDRPAGTSLDRVDNEGNYEPGNCRWATPQMQNGNRRTSIRVKVNGNEVHAAEASRLTGIPYDTVLRRAKRGINEFST